MVGVIFEDVSSVVVAPEMHVWDVTDSAGRTSRVTAVLLADGTWEAQVNGRTIPCPPTDTAYAAFNRAKALLRWQTRQAQVSRGRATG
jgi:hypothetical protein